MKEFYLIIKKEVKILSLLFLFNTAYSQTNLIPNHNFDTITFCPANIDDICKAIPWFQPVKCLPPWEVCQCGSSNLFHTCVPYDPNFLLNSIPHNMAGYQYPRTGNGYAGIAPFAGYWALDLWREYLEIKLSKQLIGNKKYCVSWFTSLAELSRYGCNNIGAYFSSDTLFQTGQYYDYIPVIPHVENLEIVTDTANWILFKQIYTAQGYERFITVGNFRKGQDTEISEVINPDGAWAYYYFDDFGIFELPEIKAGMDDTISTYGASAQLQASCTGCWQGLQYRWWPAFGLSDTTILNPVATPTQTTTYYFGLTDTSETVPCIVDLVDSVTIYVTYEPPPDSVLSFSIFPNPAKDILYIKFPVIEIEAELFIYDIRGRVVYYKKILPQTKTLELNIEKLSDSLYIVQFQNVSLKELRRFVKMQ